MTKDWENLSVSIHKGKLPNLPFLELKNEILGEAYDASISFVNSKTALSLNKKHRDKDYIPNTLSFPCSENLGEVFLQLETIYAQAADFEMTKDKYLLFIFIHSLLHLKGHDHGEKMDKLEQKYLQKYATI